MSLRLVGGRDVAALRAREHAFSVTVGARLKGWRVAADRSLEWMGKQLGIHETQVMRHEAGTTPLTCVRAARMCEILGHTMLELFE